MFGLIPHLYVQCTPQNVYCILIQTYLVYATRHIFYLHTNVLDTDVPNFVPFISHKMDVAIYFFLS